MLKNENEHPKNTFDKIITSILWIIFMPIAILFKLCFSIVYKTVNIFLFIDGKIK